MDSKIDTSSQQALKPERDINGNYMLVQHTLGMRIKESDPVTDRALVAFFDTFVNIPRKEWNKDNRLRLDLDVISDKDLVMILIDCTLYKTNDLVNMAFKLLVQHFSQRATLVDALGRVRLLPSSMQASEFELMSDMVKEFRSIVECLEQQAGEFVERSERILELSLIHI